jgi:hypothetical protein
MTRVLGMPPISALKQCYRARDFFCIGDGKNGSGQLELNAELAAKEPTLVRYLPYDELSHVLFHMLPHMGEEECQALCSLLQGLLQWEPECRWSGQYALSQLGDQLNEEYHHEDAPQEVI